MKAYFPNLSYLRAIAAVIVVIGHIEMRKHQLGIPSLDEGSPFYSPDGKMAVIMFFVLSGFLITYLLLKEKDTHGQFKLKNFYMRRILRVWPLYYFVLILTLLFVQNDYSITTILLSFTIFPNVAQAIGQPWTSSPQIWSIGVEEQFYLLFPVILRLLSRRSYLPLLLTFFIGYTLFPYFLYWLNQYTLKIEDLSVMHLYFYSAKFNCLSLGCIIGVIYADYPKILRFLQHRFIAIPSITLCFLFWFGHFEFRYFQDEIFGLLFALSILNLATNPLFIASKKWGFLDFLGRISYGIYMYHWIIILLFMDLFPYDQFESHAVYNLLFYPFVLCGSVLIAWLSYATLEKYFLSKKQLYRS